MIPKEVADIADILIEEGFDISEEEAIQIAYKIYNALTLCKC